MPGDNGIEEVEECQEDIDTGYEDGYFREHREMMNKMEAYEIECKARLDARVTVFDCDHYNQAFLAELIPKGEGHIPIRGARPELVKALDKHRKPPIPWSSMTVDEESRVKTVVMFKDWCRRHYRNYRP